jgi:hypothetical protein
VASDLYIAGKDTNTLQEGMTQLETILKKGASITGIVSQTPSKDNIDALDRAREEYDSKAKTITNELYSIYTTANYRDAKYCTVGRKFMRVLGAQGKLAAYESRIRALTELEPVE